MGLGQLGDRGVFLSVRKYCPGGNNWGDRQVGVCVNRVGGKYLLFFLSPVSPKWSSASSAVESLGWTKTGDGKRDTKRV